MNSIVLYVQDLSPLYVQVPTIREKVFWGSADRVLLDHHQRHVLRQDRGALDRAEVLSVHRPGNNVCNLILVGLDVKWPGSFVTAAVDLMVTCGCFFFG